MSISNDDHDRDASGPSPSGWGQGDAMRELVLVKNGRRVVIRCQPGEEADLLSRLGELVHDPDVDLSWFDAAVLSHQLGQRMTWRMTPRRRR